MSWIEITNVRDLQVGDVAKFLICGEPYTGRVYGTKDDLRFAGYRIWGEGEDFISAYREVKLPTDPLSVITDVVTVHGNEYPLAVLEVDYFWSCYGSGGALDTYVPSENIGSFKLAKVVEA